ncbi:cytochrome bd-type quinol oxidase subunit 1 [Arthrobacter sp. B3I9]|nr:cytochrome bd-type quinol oxidase subunit 1 [Arthrobacter sp. B3I9]
MGVVFFLALYAIVLVGALTYFVKFVRKQRDDYRRERGKRPEASGGLIHVDF